MNVYYLNEVEANMVSLQNKVQNFQDIFFFFFIPSLVLLNLLFYSVIITQEAKLKYIGRNVKLLMKQKLLNV